MKKDSKEKIDQIIDFKDRKRELKIITESLKSNKFEFMLTFGRRRVGKTELHLHATKDLKVIYYLARKGRNEEKFKEQCVKTIPEAEMIMTDYESLFKFLKDKVDVIIIDEFPEMVREEKNVLNIFQYIVDIILKNSKLKLFLLGSSISMMKSEILSAPSPLYGRKTISLHLKPFNFHTLKEFYPEATLKEIIQIYGFSGGIPYYLNQITVPFWEWLKKELKRQTFIRDEAEFLLRYEFFNSGRYFSILEAIAFGKNQLNQIAQYTKIPVTSLPQYLTSLEEVNFMKREVPVTEQKSTKRGSYILSDNFLRFYFRFIYPNLESLDRMIMDVRDIRTQYPEYMGKIFEDVVSQFLIDFRKDLDFIKLNENIELGEYFNFTKIGRWWWKEDEIDLIAFNPQTNKAILIECKWQDDVNGIEVVTNLLNKKSKIRYRGKYKNKEHILIIFAKSFKNKTNIKQIGETSIIYITLEDMNEILEKRYS